MLQFAKKCLKLIKLFALYWGRIVFVRNKFKVSFIKKLRANIFGGYLADQWVLYDFDHNDKREYLSEFDWYRSRYINEPFDFLMNNKIAAAEVLKQYTRIPENYMIKNKGFLSSFNSEEKEYEAAVELLKEKGTLFIKPYALGKGIGVNRLSYVDGKLFVDKTEHSEEEFIGFLKGRDNWFLCESMKQHQYSDDIYDKTVNTIRLITLRDIHTHQFKIFFAVQRIGTKATIPVDNGSRGGLVAKIDLDTGILSEARCLHNLDSFDVHPDSQAPIKGAQIPRWEEIKKEILELADKLPYMHFVAWDILITESGELCIIEANTSSGVNIIQLWGGQRNGELGEFFRYHGVKC